MATEPEAYQRELVAEEEPLYLRRQRPLEIRRRKLGRRSWQLYRRVLVGGTAAVVGGWLLYGTVHFFLHSSWVMLARADQIELTGNH